MIVYVFLCIWRLIDLQAYIITPIHQQKTWQFSTHVRNNHLVLQGTHEQHCWQCPVPRWRAPVHPSGSKSPLGLPQQGIALIPTRVASAHGCHGRTLQCGLAVRYEHLQRAVFQALVDWGSFFFVEGFRLQNLHKKESIFLRNSKYLYSSQDACS